MNPIGSLDHYIAQFYLVPHALTVFRPDPEAEGKEGWPSGRVWRIHGSTPMGGTEHYFQFHPLRFLEGGLWGVAVWAYCALRRRRWLKENAHSAPLSLCKRAAPLA